MGVSAGPHIANIYLHQFEHEYFKVLYEKYERENKGIKVVKARKIWLKILDSQMETGVPYMLYKDHANNKSNQKNFKTVIRTYEP